jgi:uncharacterized membrane protein
MQTLTVEVPRAPNELRADNNSQDFTVEVRKELLRVLVVDSLPRWEYRFLRNALSRDPGVDVKCLLLHPGMARGDGPDYIQKFPETKEALSPFDVVFLGDVGIGDGELTAQQMELVKGLVEQQGSGLVFMPGPRGRIKSLMGSPLADLLPVQLDMKRPEGYRTSTPSKLVLTQKGSGHLLTLLAATEDENYRLWQMLPGFSWYAAVEKIRPGAEVLGVHEVHRSEWGKLPLLVTRPAGLGKVLFMGTDSAWRWRCGVEDKYHYRFWGQVVRWMSYQRHLAYNQGFRVLLNPDNPLQGETVYVNATVLDARGGPLMDGHVTADIMFANGKTERQALTQVPGGWGMYRGEFVARHPGKAIVRLSCQETGKEMETELPVRSLQREQIGRPAQSEIMREIALITQGRYGSPSDLAGFVERINALPRSQALEQRLALWCHPAWGALIITLLAIYWLGRKLAGLI